MLELERKLKGAFFTSGDISDYLVARVIKNPNLLVLEPSFGDGSFIDAIIENNIKLNNTVKYFDNIFAIEIREESINKYRNHLLLNFENLICDDFLNVNPFPVDVVIGNPPYVGLNKLQEKEKDRAQRLLKINDFHMQSSGSLWLPFILHACSFLNSGGTIAFVLPFEFTYVKYAKQLWKYLGQHFSKLSVIRVFEDMFPSVDVETVLFIAQGFGGFTNFINYEIYDSKFRLLNNMVNKQISISIESILNDDRPFVSSLLSADQTNLIYELRIQNTVIPVRSYCKFKIGYVCADQKYFHPTELDERFYKIEKSDLIPSIPNAKVLRNVGLEVKANQIHSNLFYPKTFSSSQSYISLGTELGVNNRYKCRNRNPWYRTPGIEYADIFLNVFGDKPRLYINSGHYLASNSLLCGFLDKKISPTQFALCWYNSYTLLSIELNIHSLGGGVMIFIPGETDRIEVIDFSSAFDFQNPILEKMDTMLKRGYLDEVYQLGDEFSLLNQKLTKYQINTLRDGLNILRAWRNPQKRQIKTINQDILCPQI